MTNIPKANKPTGPLGRQTLIIVFALLLTVAVNLFWWLYHGRTEDQFARQLDARLNSLAIAGAASLSPEEVDKLVSGNWPIYSKALDYISRVSEADSLSQIFIVGRDYRILVSSQLEEDSFYLLAELNEVELNQVFGVGGLSPIAAVTEGYPVGDLLLKTAFAPLFGSSGEPLAALGVEADVNYTQALAELRSNLLYSSLASVIVAALFAALFLLIQRRVTRAEQAVLRSESEMNLGRMVAVVSHEIKNPLTILRSAAERISKKSDMPEAGFLIEEVDRLNKIVTGYLDFARSPDRVVLQYTPVDEVIDHLREMSGQLRLRLQKDEVTLTTIIPPTHSINKEENRESVEGSVVSDAQMAILLDSSALRQVALNLVLNAADAAKNARLQGKLEEDEPEVRLAVEINGDKFSLSVRDNGLGISAKDQKRLFEPFYTTKQHGSGLGLYLSQKLVQRMRGVLTVTSLSGGPTTFSFTLPITKPTTAPIITDSKLAQS